jgi:hypothetical protein
MALSQTALTPVRVADADYLNVSGKRVSGYSVKRAKRGQRLPWFWFNPALRPGQAGTATATATANQSVLWRPLHLEAFAEGHVQVDHLHRAGVHLVEVAF